jgi:hypothetical protein
MSITKINVPENVVLSNNYIPVRVLNDKYRVSPGTRQVLRIVLAGNTTAGKTITFTWRDFAMVMTFSASPDDSGMQLPLYNSASSTGYVALLDAFRSNYYLTKYYTLTFSVIQILGVWTCTCTWTQKKFGQEFRATAFTGNDSGNYTPTILAGYAAPTYSASYRALVDIYWQNNPAGAREFNLVTQLDASSDETDLAEFNLQEIFDKWGILKPDFPVMSDVGIERCPNVMKHYYLVISESYGNPEIVHNNVTEPATIAANTFLKVIKGGMPFLKYPVNTFYADYINSSSNKFLTTQVSGSTTVCKEQKHWLYFYLKNTITSFRIKATLYLSNGTTATFTGSTSSPLQQTINRASVGYSTLGLGSLLSGQELLKYEVWIEDDTAVRLTEKFMFLMDTRYYQYNNYLYFHNSLGGVDCAWLTGDVFPVPEVTGNELHKSIAYDYSSGNIQAFNSKTRWGWEFNSGYKSIKGEIDHLVELMQSNDVRWLPDEKIRPGYTEPLKIIISKDSVKDWPADSLNMYSLTFSAKEAHYEY